MPVTLRDKLTACVQASLATLYDTGFLDKTQGDAPTVFLAPPKHAAHGDFSCTVALSLARAAGKKPRNIAEKLQEALGLADGLLEKTEIAGPGYLNLHVSLATWHAVLAKIIASGIDFVHSDRGAGEPVLVEFVSANPTGPLHVAHGRGAVLGDVIASILATAGYRVEREYYINDLGHQTDVLARSIYLRYAELQGETITPPADFYPGEYIIDIAREVQKDVGTAYLNTPETTWLLPLRQRGIDAMMQRIRTDLSAFGVRFDRYVSERQLTEQVDLAKLVAKLEAAGHIYEQDGKKWFRSTSFGDEKDRVVVREDGRPTYFAADLAYHDDKLRRGFKRIIDVWGADHGGYVARIKAGLVALGHSGDPLTVVFLQMVSLTRGGEAVRMGKRLGTAVWLQEIIAEAGRDATRYLFIMRRPESQMDFDIDLATRKSLDNPVFYAQMGHARLASIQRRAREAGIALPAFSADSLDALTLPEEIELIKALARAPDVIADAAEALEPHQVVTYLQSLIAQFHSYYSQYKSTERVISDDAKKTMARLFLCQGLQIVLQALLQILGVAAPHRMSLTDSNDEE